jgi:NAD(P)-dependent dehydrogenase (short-subunit alcohol dehydrogenase family)
LREQSERATEQDLNRLTGRLAIVTGAGPRIGAAVVVGDIDVEQAVKVASDGREHGGTAAGFRVDVTSPLVSFRVVDEAGRQMCDSLHNLGI